MRISTQLKALGLAKVLSYLERDPDANLPKLKEWLERFMERRLPPHYQQLFHSAMSDPSNNWYQLIVAPMRIPTPLCGKSSSRTL